jgi:hypothetical protein
MLSKASLVPVACMVVSMIRGGFHYVGVGQRGLTDAQALQLNRASVDMDQR